jgi:tyrosine-protein kinase Etk/Wzc
VAQEPRLELELSVLETDLFNARMRREEIGRLRTALSNRLEGIPAEVVIQRPSVMIPNEEYETQLALKRQALTQKQEMLIQSRPSEEVRRREREFDRQIAKIDEKLKQTPKAIPQDSELQENLSHSAMEARIVDLEVEDEALPVKIGLLETRLEAKKSRLSEIQKQLLAANLERNDLKAARDAEEARYAHHLERVSVVEALQDIDANDEANLSVLQEPTLEPEKVGPRRGSLLLKGLLAGMLAGIAIAILRQRFGRRLIYPDTFERSRGLPVLGVVPHLASLHHLDERALIAGR